MQPAAKFCCLFGLILTTFSLHTALQLIAGAVVVLGMSLSTRVPLRHILKSIQLIFIFLVIVALFNLFFVQTGTQLIKLGILRITSGGVFASVLYTLRFFYALILGSLILLTTTQTELTDAFDRLLSPLARLHLPAHEIAMVFSLMLRFIPMLARETQALLDAQTMRGASFGEGSFSTRLHAIIPLIISLFSGGIRHAEGVARALDARCYVGSATRTHLHDWRFTKRDAYKLGICIIVAAVLISIGFL